MKTRTINKHLTALTVLLCSQASMSWAADATTVYERSIANDAGITVWSDDDKSSTEWNGGAIDETNGLMLSLSSKSTTSISKNLPLTASSIVTYDILWNLGSSDYAQSGTTSLIQIGNKFEIKATNKASKTAFNINGSEVKSMGDLRNKDLLIHLIVNTHERTITALSISNVSGEEPVSLITFDNLTDAQKQFDADAIFNIITLGVTNTTSKGHYTRNFLKRIVVQEETQNVSNYSYTVNYKEGENIVKTVSGSLAENSLIPVLSALDGEGEYEGNHYLITANETPKWLISSTESSNIKEVQVRKPYTTTLNVYRIIDGIKEAEPVTTKKLTETDTKEAIWIYTFPYAILIDNVYYIATLKEGKFGEQGTFTTEESIEKTIEYTSNTDIIGFWDANASGENINYSGGSFNTYWREDSLGTLPAGSYELIVGQQDGYGCTLYSGWTDAENRGTNHGTSNKDNRSLIFTLNAEENLYLYTGSNARMDYYMIKRNPTVNAIIGEKGWATFSAARALDFSSVAGIEAYAVTVSDNFITLHQVNAVPAHTGILLKGTAGEYAIPAIGTADALETNDLVPTTGTMLSEDGYAFYGLTAHEDKVCFGLISDFAPSAGKAALKVATASNAPAFFFIDKDVITGITSKNFADKSTDKVFNIMGRQVNRLNKGIYIMNGKKIIR